MLLGLLGGVLGVVGVYLAEEWAVALGWRLAVAARWLDCCPRGGPLRSSRLRLSAAESELTSALLVPVGS